MQKSTFLWLLLLMIAVFGSGGGLIYYVCKADILELSEGDPCPERQGFPSRTCVKEAACTTLNDYKDLNLSEENEKSCDFSSPNPEKLICCPDLLPLNFTTTIQPPIKPQTLIFKYLASVGYYEQISMDDYEYRYTAIVLSPSHVLATSPSLKLSNNMVPVHVILGTSDPRVYVDTQVFRTVVNRRKITMDLALYELENPISENQLLKTISIANLCDRADFLNSPNMKAIGYAQNQTYSTSCAMFTKQVQLVDFNKCHNVLSTLKLEDIVGSKTHLCVTPGTDHFTPGDDNRCSKCLTATSSVLHVQRPDGSFCVGGIATPTTNECVVNSEPLYYTILQSGTLRKFIPPALREI
ncbi:uncharacterized protein LOC117789871 [Drosophila innubila]|uniref:uncharacterized protein LOC117789871 n=1 Tax=Drosophila innubila TaxID=198719 RepID=UPI00148C4DC9|nr:uncharacterized protein LOC117789871 [Drosophila innubila]